MCTTSYYWRKWFYHAEQVYLPVASCCEVCHLAPGNANAQSVEGRDQWAPRSGHPPCGCGWTPGGLASAIAVGGLPAGVSLQCPARTWASRHLSEERVIYHDLLVFVFFVIITTTQVSTMPPGILENDSWSRWSTTVICNHSFMEGKERTFLESENTRGKKVRRWVRGKVSG